MTEVTKIRTLGGCQVDGNAVRYSRPVELVAALALSGGRVQRDWLLSTLFERDPSPSSLPTIALRARKLGVDVRYDRDTRCFELVGDVDCDVVVLTRRLKQGRLMEALDMYRGPFLSKSHSPFAMDMRASLESQLVSAVIRSGDVEAMSIADRSIKHPELSEFLVRRSADPVRVSLNRSWLAGLEPVG